MLSDPRRLTSNGNGTTASVHPGKADVLRKSYISPDWKGPGWYRMMVKDGGSFIPETSPGPNHCGTNAVGWLRGTHPETTGVTVEVTYCFDWAGNSCLYHRTGKITHCGDFFVYYLHDGPNGCYRYCAANSTTPIAN